MSTLERTLTGVLAASAMAGRTGLSLAQRGSRAAQRLAQGKGRTNRTAGQTFTRTSAITSLPLIAGEISTSSTNSLSQVQTSDLIGMYDEYKINWVKVHLVPRVDPGNSGITNNTNCLVSTACDVTGQVTAPTSTQVGAFDNYKAAFLTSGHEFTYVYRPKAINALASGNFAINRGDWLILSATGVAVPHQLFLLNVKSSLSTVTFAFDYFFEINFSVRQAS